jgi:hypothetical protein
MTPNVFLKSSAAEKRGQTSSLPSSSDSFHPISPERSDFQDNTDVSGSTSDLDFCFDKADVDVEMELTPYPYTTTSEEIKDWHQLELSFGEDWSLRLACELSSSEMSIDSDSDDDSSLFQEDETTACPKDDNEIRVKRNLLWKQSLKRSMFTTMDSMNQVAQ